MTNSSGDNFDIPSFLKSPSRATVEEPRGLPKSGDFLAEFEARMRDEAERSALSFTHPEPAPEIPAAEPATVSFQEAEPEAAEAVAEAMAREASAHRQIRRKPVRAVAVGAAVAVVALLGGGLVVSSLRPGALPAPPKELVSAPDIGAMEAKAALPGDPEVKAAPLPAPEASPSLLKAPSPKELEEKPKTTALEPASAEADTSATPPPWQAAALAIQPSPQPPPLAQDNSAAPAAAPTVTEVADSSPTPAPAASAVHGVSDREIRFGMVSPFSGPNREAGRQLKIGVDVAFAAANEAGGVEGRQLKLLTADDGYEPARTVPALTDLYEKQDVMGFIGDFGTATSEAALPYVLSHKALYLGALSGAGLLRRDPPDRYVFNYRPSYSEETGAAVRYLVKVRRLKPSEIAVFAQDDGFGDAGYDGVAKAMRALPDAPDTVLRLGYKRNTIDVTDALNQLRKTRGRIKAIVMVATYRAAAKFIEKTRDQMPGLIYTNVSAVGATSLADELKLLGPSYAKGVVVTQVTPSVASSATSVLKYKAALAKFAPGEAPDASSLESYIDATVLIEALKKAGRQVDTEKLVDSMESLHDLDLGIGTILRFSPNEHQGSHKVWGTQLDDNGYVPIDLE